MSVKWLIHHRTDQETDETYSSWVEQHNFIPFFHSSSVLGSKERINTVLQYTVLQLAVYFCDMIPVNGLSVDFDAFPRVLSNHSSCGEPEETYFVAIKQARKGQGINGMYCSPFIAWWLPQSVRLLMVVSSET